MKAMCEITWIACKYHSWILQTWMLYGFMCMIYFWPDFLKYFSNITSMKCPLPCSGISCCNVGQPRKFTSSHFPTLNKFRTPWHYKKFYTCQLEFRWGKSMNWLCIILLNLRYNFRVEEIYFVVFYTFWWTKDFTFVGSICTGEVFIIDD